MNNLKIELHLLQNFPPSCLNRDDTNTPKTCEFGGVTRARVSSQCWKRAIREEFKETAPERRGTRSKRLKGELITALVQAEKGTIESLGVPVEKFVTTFYAGPDKKRHEETNVLVFYSQAEFATMLEVLSEDGMLAELSKEAPVIKKNEIEKRLKASAMSTDVALFARMLADAPGLNIDAACQVAHAISTHSVNLELDFYTAVDDLKDTNDNDDAGAGMLGTVGYDSACYYRYALVDDAQLRKNLNDSAEDAAASLQAFLEAFCDAIPGAKKNSFAPGNPPFFVFFVVRQEGTPASLVNAFAKPVKPYAQIGNKKTGDLLTESALAFAAQVENFKTRYELYQDASAQCHYFKGDAELPALHGNEHTTIREAIAGVMDSVKAFRAAQKAAEAQK